MAISAKSHVMTANDPRDYHVVPPVLPEFRHLSDMVDTPPETRPEISGGASLPEIHSQTGTSSRFATHSQIPAGLQKGETNFFDLVQDYRT